MEWLNYNAPAVQAFAAVMIALLTLSLVVVNLWYAATTRRIAKASIEQSEALQKPFITLETIPRDYDDTILDDPNAARVAQRPTVVLCNLGVGPALNLICRFRQTKNEREGTPLDHKESVPSLRPQEKWATALPVTCLDIETVEFNAKYRALSGTEYETRMTLENRVVVTFYFGPRSQ